LYYIKHRNLGLDILILLRTVECAWIEGSVMSTKPHIRNRYMLLGDCIFILASVFASYALRLDWVRRVALSPLCILDGWGWLY
jgi:hypothetical protein